MRILGGTLLAVAAVGLSACSTTTLASTPTPAAEPTVATTVPVTTVAPTTPPTTQAPTTTQAPATTKAPKKNKNTTTTTTTTTIPNNIVGVEKANPPIQPIGTDSGVETERAQWRLIELGFWIEEVNGSYDATTQQAVMAFQKYYGLETDGALGPVTAEALTNVTVKPHGRSDAGDLVEIDKGKQLLFIVRDGTPAWIFNTSTGSEEPYEEADQNTPGEVQTGDSVTRNGLWDVYRQREEGWWEGDLGKIYRPKYFTGGIAVHGSNYIPDFPASHGCVRVTVSAMDWIWANDMMPMDSPVWVHEGAPERYEAEVDLAKTLNQLHQAAAPATTAPA